MNKTVRVLLLALAMPTLAASPSLMQAAGPAAGSSGWDQLKTLSPGQPIRVVLNDAKSYQGVFQSLSDDGITLRQPGGNQTLARRDVLRVSSKGRKHRARNVLIGAAIGAGAGLAIGAALDRQSQGTFIQLHHWGIAVGTPLGALLGAGGGALLPTGGWHDLYRAH